MEFATQAVLQVGLIVAFFTKSLSLAGLAILGGVLLHVLAPLLAKRRSAVEPNYKKIFYSILIFIVFVVLVVFIVNWWD
jgi:hypothetical protein